MQGNTQKQRAPVVAENDWFQMTWWTQFVNVGTLSVATSACEIGAVPALCLIAASWILFCNYHAIVWQVWSRFPLPSAETSGAASKSDTVERPQNTTDLISATFGADSMRARGHRFYATVMAVVSAWFSMTFSIALGVDIFIPEHVDANSVAESCQVVFTGLFLVSSFVPVHVHAKTFSSATSKTATLLISIGVVGAVAYVAYFGIRWSAAAPAAIEAGTTRAMFGAFRPFSQGLVSILVQSFGADSLVRYWHNTYKHQKTLPKTVFFNHYKAVLPCAVLLVLVSTATGPLFLASPYSQFSIWPRSTSMVIKWFPKDDMVASAIRLAVALSMAFSLVNVAVVANDVTNVFVAERERVCPSRHPRVLFLRMGIALVAGIFAIAVPRVAFTYILIASLSFAYYLLYLPLQLAAHLCRQNTWMSPLSYVLALGALGYFAFIMAGTLQQ